MAGRLASAFAFAVVPTAALVVATLLTNIAVTLAVVGGGAGIVSAVFVVVRVSELSTEVAGIKETTERLSGKAGELTERADSVTDKLRGE